MSKATNRNEVEIPQEVKDWRLEQVAETDNQRVYYLEYRRAESPIQGARSEVLTVFVGDDGVWRVTGQAYPRKNFSGEEVRTWEVEVTETLENALIVASEYMRDRSMSSETDSGDDDDELEIRTPEVENENRVRDRVSGAVENVREVVGGLDVDVEEVGRRLDTGADMDEMLGLGGGGVGVGETGMSGAGMAFNPTGGFEPASMEDMGLGFGFTPEEGEDEEERRDRGGDLEDMLGF